MNRYFVPFDNKETPKLQQVVENIMGYEWEDIPIVYETKDQYEKRMRLLGKVEILVPKDSLMKLLKKIYWMIVGKPYHICWCWDDYYHRLFLSDGSYVNILYNAFGNKKAINPHKFALDNLTLSGRLIK